LAISERETARHDDADTASPLRRPSSAPRVDGGRILPALAYVRQGEWFFLPSGRPRWTSVPGSSNGRTSRSERGDRGSTPCPGASGADSSTGRAPVLQTGGRWFDSSSAYFS